MMRWDTIVSERHGASIFRVKIFLDYYKIILYHVVSSREREKKSNI